jgi:hypothetical protein
MYSDRINALLSAGRYDDAVAEYVCTGGGISFVELQALLEDHLPTTGDRQMAHPKDPNVVIWMGMSPEFVTIINLVLAQRRIFLHPADSLVYAFDGQIPKLPLAGRRVPGGYKSPRWLPMVFQPKPFRGRRAQRPPASG